MSGPTLPRAPRRPPSPVSAPAAPGSPPARGAAALVAACPAEVVAPERGAASPEGLGVGRVLRHVRGLPRLRSRPPGRAGNQARRAALGPLRERRGKRVWQLTRSVPPAVVEPIGSRVRPGGGRCRGRGAVARAPAQGATDIHRRAVAGIAIRSGVCRPPPLLPAGMAAPALLDLGRYPYGGRQA